MNTISKEELIQKLVDIKHRSWIHNSRRGNAGSVGNLLEDLLGIHENNLPIPNAGEWELKCQAVDTTSLTTLFHMEPSPRACKFVPKMLLPNYGWPHQEAGLKYPASEMSFRQTINGLNRTDRGFGIQIDDAQKKISISFDSTTVDARHSAWLETVESRVGLGELNPQPYWGFDDIFHKAGVKLLNCFYILAERKFEDNQEYFKYSCIMMLSKFTINKFISAIKDGAILIDFDARTGHNHGTKFRMKNGSLNLFYENVVIL